METINDFGDGAMPLYVDTDSVIFRYPLARKDEIFELLGVEDFLGHLKDEKPGKTILEYVCGGAKAYALKVNIF